ncbi:hypothetical protein J2S46_006754 [Kitasatospora herbaricolor]|nr:hypothetical protein [Kitasatospora herbaricolor]
MPATPPQDRPSVLYQRATALRAGRREVAA